MQALEQEKEYLTAENESLAFKISEVKADIEKLEDEKLQFKKDKDAAEKRCEESRNRIEKTGGQKRIPATSDG